MFPNVRYDQASIPLSTGDRLFLHTDGVTECPALDGDLYGEDRLRAALNRARNVPLEAVKETVYADLSEFAQVPLDHDDWTLIAIEVRE